VCNGVIRDQAVEALGKMYHPEHFCCFGCGASLDGEIYKEDEGNPYCGTCKAARVVVRAPPVHTCGICHKPIYGEFILLNGQHVRVSLSLSLSLSFRLRVAVSCVLFLSLLFVMRVF
jgi:LIM domain